MNIVVKCFIKPLSKGVKKVLYFLKMFFIFVIPFFSFYVGLPCGTPVKYYKVEDQIFIRSPMKQNSFSGPAPHTHTLKMVLSFVKFRGPNLFFMLFKELLFSPTNLRCFNIELSKFFIKPLSSGA